MLKNSGAIAFASLMFVAACEPASTVPATTTKTAAPSAAHATVATARTASVSPSRPATKSAARPTPKHPSSSQGAAPRAERRPISTGQIESYTEPDTRRSKIDVRLHD